MRIGRCRGADRQAWRSLDERPTTRRASSWLPDDFDAKNSHCEVRDKASMFKGFGVEAV